MILDFLNLNNSYIDFLKRLPINTSASKMAEIFVSACQKIDDSCHLHVKIRNFSDHPRTLCSWDLVIVADWPLAKLMADVDFWMRGSGSVIGEEREAETRKHYILFWPLVPEKRKIFFLTFQHAGKFKHERKNFACTTQQFCFID